MSICARAALLTVAITVSGCGPEDDPFSLTGGRPPGAASTDPAATAAPDGGTSPRETAFTYEPDIALLPFDVRLTKVASVAGVEPTDPILDTIRARRLELGDHDYASGVKPDLSWSSARIGTWVKALKPVCASPAMRTRYPALPEKLGDLLVAAYGREATDDDRAIMQETIQATALDSESQYRTVCLAILSSLEFVAR